MNETRKLAAILAADVAGYNRLTATEERTIARLRALRSDLFDPAISLQHGARMFHRRAERPIERNAGLPPARQIWLRICIHLGDVIAEADGDLMGDSVNIASRHLRGRFDLPIGAGPIGRSSLGSISLLGISATRN